MMDKVQETQQKLKLGVTFDDGEIMFTDKDRAFEVNNWPGE